MSCDAFKMYVCTNKSVVIMLALQTRGEKSDNEKLSCFVCVCLCLVKQAT